MCQGDNLVFDILPFGHSEYGNLAFNIVTQRPGLATQTGHAVV
jgi:hypothetical protein